MLARQARFFEVAFSFVLGLAVFPGTAYALETPTQAMPVAEAQDVGSSGKEASGAVALPAKVSDESVTGNKNNAAGSLSNENTGREAKAKAEPDSGCEIKCLDPQACCEESKKIISILQELAQAIVSGDLATFDKYLDEHCTSFDETSKKLVVGKQALLDEIRGKLKVYGQDGKKPLKTYTIDYPYAKTAGDSCVVTYVVHKETGGNRPGKEKSRVTAIFTKHEGEWKLLHYRGWWKNHSA